MDNMTATACKNCKALLFYDKDAPKPKLCPVCLRAERQREIDKLIEENGG